VEIEGVLEAAKVEGVGEVAEVGEHPDVTLVDPVCELSSPSSLQRGDAIEEQITPTLSTLYCESLAP